MTDRFIINDQGKLKVLGSMLQGLFREFKKEFVIIKVRSLYELLIVV